MARAVLGRWCGITVWCFLYFVTQAIAADRPDIQGFAEVIDADSIEIGGRRIRLHGIDAVESGQLCRRNNQDWRCGTDGTKAVREMVAGRQVRCVPLYEDGYARTVATCWIGEKNLNDWIVRQGWGLAYRKYSKDYLAAEAEAEMNGRGIWQAEFTPPWDWRRAMRAPAVYAATLKELGLAAKGWASTLIDAALIVLVGAAVFLCRQLVGLRRDWRRSTLFGPRMRVFEAVRAHLGLIIGGETIDSRDLTNLESAFQQAQFLFDKNVRNLVGSIASDSRRILDVKAELTRANGRRQDELVAQRDELLRRQHKRLDTLADAFAEQL